MRRRAVRRAMAIAVAAGVVALTMAAGAQSAVERPAVATAHEVAPGDTLWALAGRLDAPGADRRELVWLLKQVNRLSTATLYPGQQLILPAGADSLRAARRSPAEFAARAVIVEPPADPRARRL